MSMPDGHFDFHFQVNRIKMDFSSAKISRDELTSERIQTLLADAREQIYHEQQSTDSKH